MGIVRKIASVSSLGLISSKSAKEKQRLAQAELAKEQAKTLRAERERRER